MTRISTRLILSIKKCLDKFTCDKRPQIIKALTHDVFDWEGEFFKIPRMSIRPRPVSHPERRFYASSVSPDGTSCRAS